MFIYILLIRPTIWLATTTTIYINDAGFVTQHVGRERSHLGFYTNK